MFIVIVISLKPAVLLCVCGCGCVYMPVSVCLLLIDRVMQEDIFSVITLCAKSFSITACIFLTNGVKSD